MGGYDLYGNYYESAQDAWNAETAQMNEIDNRTNQRRLDEQQREIRRIREQLNKLATATDQENRE